MNLTQFDSKTLSNISWLIMKRVKYIQSRAHVYLLEIGNAELDRLLPFNCQVLEAFMVARERERISQSLFIQQY